MKRVSKPTTQQAMFDENNTFTDFSDFAIDVMEQEINQVEDNPLDEENVICGTDVLNESVEWIIPDVLPKSETTLFFGMPETGKSMLLAYFLALVTSQGMRWEGKEVVHGKILYVSTEVKPYITLQRITANGGDASKCFFVKKVKISDGKSRDTTTISNFKLHRDSALLKKIVKQVKPAIIVFDTLMSMCSNMKNDVFQDKVVNMLQDLAEDTGCAIACIAHIKTGIYNQQNITTMIKAPSELFETVRTAYMSGIDDNTGCFIMKSMKSNNGKGASPIVYNVMKTEVGPLVKFPQLAMVDIEIPGSAQKNLQRSIAAYIAKYGASTNIEIATQFMELGNTAYINVALSRMVASNVLTRKERGLYDLSNDFKRHICLTVVSSVPTRSITQQVTAILP